MPGTYDSEAEKYIIYNVSKEEYDTCRITNSNPRIIAICDKPYKLMYFTITFRPFTPQPGGLEFSPGKDYYFISTSSKDDLHRRIGGRCTSHNMKIVFKVCCAPDVGLNSTTISYGIASSTKMSIPYMPTNEITTISATTELVAIQASSPTKKFTKKTNEYDKHPNDVVKNEELTYNKGILLAAPSVLLLIIIAIGCVKWQ